MEGNGWLMASPECLAKGSKRASDAPVWQIVTAVQVEELLADMSQTDYMLSADACHRRAVQETAGGRRLHRPLWPEPPPCRGQGAAPGPPAIKVMHIDGGSGTQTPCIIQQVAPPTPCSHNSQILGMLNCHRSHGNVLLVRCQPMQRQEYTSFCWCACSHEGNTWKESACRESAQLYSWIDPRSDEFHIDISTSRNPVAHVASSQPPPAPRTMARR